MLDMLTFHPLTDRRRAARGQRRGLRDARSAGGAARRVPFRARAAHRRARDDRRPGSASHVFDLQRDRRASFAHRRARARARQHVAVTSAEALRVGDKLEVLPPTGRFFLDAGCEGCAHVLCVRGGSGITPILGIVRNVLRARARAAASCCSTATARPRRIMFAEELLALKDRYPAAPRRCTS